jgi:5-methylcytosine-specific restriction protein A
MKRTEMKRRPRSTGPIPEVVHAVYARAMYSCELCGAPVGDRRGVDHHVHHRRPRRMGGTQLGDTNDVVNLLLLDPSCHERIESERSVGYAGGWLVRQEETPGDVPVLVCGSRWVLLTADAKYLTVASPPVREDP